ncbi:gamma-glutamyltransferase [Komagataeibacter intermedius]|uniref:gamma-glutamyltransferase n=1 Tax=Komagataeibacter intermedius TaxID=66229 RepID=UPI003B436F91
MTTGSHWRVADGYSSPVMPVLSGCTGAVSAAHPLAVAAGQEILGQGGSAVDAAIAAQAVLCVVSPDACGIGGDLFAIIDDSQSVKAISGAGAAPASGHDCAIDGANSITVPGLPGAWSVMHDRWGVLPLEACLKRATLIAQNGFEVSACLGRTLAGHDERLRQNGSAACPWRHVKAGEKHVQPQLAEVLRAFARTGPACFYTDGVDGLHATSMCHDEVGRPFRGDRPDESYHNRPGYRQVCFSSAWHGRKRKMSAQEETRAE